MTTQRNLLHIACVLNITSNLLVNKWEIKYVSRLFVECCKRNDGNCYKAQILRILELPVTPLVTEIFYSIHVLNFSKKPTSDLITYNEYFQFVTCFCLLPFRVMSRFILAMTEVQNCHFIDFNTALKLINLLHDPTYSKTDLMSLYNFYKISPELPLDYENLMRIIKSQKYYTSLHNIYRSIQKHVYTISLYDSIKFKVKNYGMIATYQLDHNGELPPLSCANKLESILLHKPHPLSYDYHGVTDDDLIDISRKLKGKRLFLSTERRSTPVITKLISTGETQGICANMAKRNPQYTPIYAISGFKLSVPLHTSRAAASSYCNNNIPISVNNTNRCYNSSIDNNNNNTANISTIAVDQIGSSYYNNYNGNGVDANSIVDSTATNYSLFSPNSTKINTNSPSNSHHYLSPPLQSPPTLSPPLLSPLKSAPETLPPVLSVQISGNSSNKVKYNQILPIQYESSPIPETSPPLSSRI